jgi:hypothetical protein
VTGTVNFVLRIPAELHAKLKSRSEREQRSLQGQILYLLSRVIENDPEKWRSANEFNLDVIKQLVVAAGGEIVLTPASREISKAYERVAINDTPQPGMTLFKVEPRGGHAGYVATSTGERESVESNIIEMRNGIKIEPYEAFVIKDNVAYVDAWEWKSTQSSLFGRPVLGWANGWKDFKFEEHDTPPNVPGGDPGYQSTSSAIAPSIHLAFPNGWTMNISPDGPQPLGRNHFAATTAYVSTIGYPPIDMDKSRESYEFFGTLSPVETKAIILDVAKRVPWRPGTGKE